MDEIRPEDRQAILEEIYKKVRVYDEIKEIFKREAPIATEKHADIVLGDIARLFWK